MSTGPDYASFRRQVVLLAVAMSTLVAVALMLVVHVVLDGTADNAVRRALEDRADLVVSSADVSSTGGALVVAGDRLDPGVAVYDAAGALVAGEAPASLRTEFAALADADASTTATVGESYRLLAEPFTTGAGSSGVVVVSESLRPYENDERNALVVSLAAGLLIVAISTVLTAWVSRRALAPVQEMARTAERWSEHDLDRRFDLGPPTNEIRALGRTLDGLLDRVSGAIHAEQRLTSELAHELRTPLTAAQGLVDLIAMRDDLDDALRADLDDLRASCRTMAATISSLLELARSQSSSGATTCTLAEVLGALDLPADRVHVDVPVDLVLHLPAALAARTLAPLMQNALQHADLVSVTAVRSGSRAVVRVADDGPGVERSIAGDLFVPGRTGGTGSGLGLALSRRIARSAGGDVRLVPTEARQAPGAVFEVLLPLA